MGETVSANDDIIELVQSHADGDDKKFYAIAMQIAAKADTSRAYPVCARTAGFGDRTASKNSSRSAAGDD